MADPIIATAGATSGLLLITDNDGREHRVPKLSVGDIFNSSNDHVERLEIGHTQGSIILQFSTAAKLAAALVLLDAEY